MGVSKAGIKYLHVSVFRGGAEMGKCARPLAKMRSVTAGKGAFCDIRSVIWPLLDELEIILKTKDGLILNPRIAWDGVIHNGSTTSVLGAPGQRKKVFAITAATSASLRYEDLSIAIRIGPKIRSSELPGKLRSSYRVSPLTLIADSTQEWVSIGIAACASALIASFALFTLLQRPNEQYVGILQLPAENLLPFLSHRYLSEAPNVLQEGLDRLDLNRSVWIFYSDLAGVIGFGDAPVNASPLFPSTIANYTKMAEEQTTILEAAATRQQAQLTSEDTSRSIMSVPMVTGESLDGRVARVFDKINVLTDSANELADRRVSVAAEFLNGIGFTFDPRKSASVTVDNFKKISESFQGIESDDKEQFLQAKAAGARAALLQMDIFGKARLKTGLTNCCFAVVGAPLTQEGLVWLAPDFTQGGNGDLSFIKASSWGSPVHEAPIIREPLAGHIDPKDVEKIISAGRYQLRLCYEIALRRNQAAKGSMEWLMRIDSRGIVSNIDLITNSLNDEELVRCIRDRIAAWKFPKPRGGSVEVRYPFEFSRDKG